MRGRAEYEDVSREQLFEGGHASLLWPWAGESSVFAESWIRLGWETCADALYDACINVNTGKIVGKDYYYPAQKVSPHFHIARHFWYSAPTVARYTNSGPDWKRVEDSLKRGWSDERNLTAGLLLGERGYGKTFFARKLAEEVPMKIYNLNKRTLEYEVLQEESSPDVYLVDDVHILTQLMRLGKRLKAPIKTEGEVIRILQQITKEANEANAKIIYVTDVWPSVQAHDFEEEENREAFLGLLRPAIRTRQTVYRMRDNITDELALKIRRELGMLDVPLRRPESIEYAHMRVKPGYIPDWHQKELLRKTKRVAEHKLRPTNNGCVVSLAEEFYVTGTPPRDFVHAADRLSLGDLRHRPLAPLRQLRVIKDELGAVNRRTLRAESLGTEVETPSARGKKRHYAYDEDELDRLAEVIENAYGVLSEKGSIDLARELLDAKDDDAAVAAYIRFELERSGEVA